MTFYSFYYTTCIDRDGVLVWLESPGRPHVGCSVTVLDCQDEQVLKTANIFGSFECVGPDLTRLDSTDWSRILGAEPLGLSGSCFGKPSFLPDEVVDIVVAPVPIDMDRDTVIRSRVEKSSSYELMHCSCVVLLILSYDYLYDPMSVVINAQHSKGVCIADLTTITDLVAGKVLDRDPFSHSTHLSRSRPLFCEQKKLSLKTLTSISLY